jgi:hypothetical protein
MDANDMDALCNRLLRTPAGIVGCAFSVAGINQSAAGIIEEKRSQREIVAFAPDEICAIFEGRVSLLNLLEKKREMLRREGRAWFTPPVEADLPRASLLDLPYSKDRISLGGKSPRDFYSRSKDRDAFVYAKSIPETRFNGPDTALRLRLANGSITKLATILHSLNTCFGLASDAVFTIHQTGGMWTGFGVRDLLTALPRWRSRYDSVGVRDPHYSEEVILFSPCGDGWALFTAQHITESGTYHYCEVEIRLPGIPVDPTPCRMFCDAVGASPAFFTAPAEADYRKTIFYRGKAPRLRPVGLVIDRHNGDNWATGLIVENPFRTENVKVGRGDDLREIARDLRGPDHLYVRLSQHHLAEDVVDYYEVTDVEAITLAPRPIIEIRANWNRMVKSTWRERLQKGTGKNWAEDLAAIARQVGRSRSKRTGRFTSDK